MLAGHSAFRLKDEADVPAALERLRARGCAIDAMDPSQFLCRDLVNPTPGGRPGRVARETFRRPGWDL